MFEQDRLRGYGQRALPLLLLLWLAALIPTARRLLAFEWTAGTMGRAPERLTSGNAGAALPDGHERNGRAGLLIVAIHPLCSCTRATLKELEDSAASWNQPYEATFLIYTAKNQVGTAKNQVGTAKNQVGTAKNQAGKVKNEAGHLPDFDWKQAGYLVAAKHALKAEVVEDEGGERAARLGAGTSGEVLYYSAADDHGNRRLLFSGGVTGGRGMEGENGGIEALERAVRSTSSTTAQSMPSHSPVYGCGLAALAKTDGGGLAK